MFGLSLRKIVGWAIVVCLAWYLFTRPAHAAGTVHAAFTGIKAAGTSVATFLAAL